MQRIAWALLVGGVLLIAWAAAPAAPSSTFHSAPPASLAAIDAALPIVQSIDRETLRLAQQTPPPPSSPVSIRDPFSFAEPRPAAHAAASVVSAPAAPAPVSSPPAASPLLPRILAIVSAHDNSSERSAVLQMGAVVRVVNAGQQFGIFSVRAIGANTVEIVDAGGGVITLTLR